MKKVVVCLFDAKAGQFMQPFFVPAIGVAVRTLQDESQKGGDGNLLGTHPMDFSLYQIGLWDDETGVLHPQSPEEKFRLEDLVQK